VVRPARRRASIRLNFALGRTASFPRQCVNAPCDTPVMSCVNAAVGVLPSWIAPELSDQDASALVNSSLRSSLATSSHRFDSNHQFNPVTYREQLRTSTDLTPVAGVASIWVIVTGTKHERQFADEIQWGSLPIAAVIAYVSSSLSQRSARSPGMKQYSPPRVTTNLGMPCRRLRTGFRGTVKLMSCDPHNGSLSWSAPMKIPSLIHCD
jgi:hypothetical protein